MHTTAGPAGVGSYGGSMLVAERSHDDRGVECFVDEGGAPVKDISIEEQRHFFLGGGTPGRRSSVKRSCRSLTCRWYAIQTK